MKKLKSLINYILGLLFLRGFFSALNTTKILQIDYGHFLSATLWSAVDRNGKPIPWFTYPAIEYLLQFDLSKKSVFEYGSGNSTLFWEKIARKVISVEDDREWFDRIRKKHLGSNNIELLYYPEKLSYIRSIKDCKIAFDIIIIDGSYRAECARVAVKKLKKGGMIILDNADWMPDIARFLRSHGLIEIDMAGFSPINHRTTTTSLFIRRDFNFKSKLNRPLSGPGSIDVSKLK